MNYGKTIKDINPVAYQIIRNAFEMNKLSHAYIFSAPRGVVVNNEPLFLIQSLISENPFGNDELRNVSAYTDLTIIDGSEKAIVKNSVINAVEKLQQTALDAKGIKILYIKNIDNSNKQSLNSLLKFIEEPQNNTYIVMTTNNLTNVITTIKSRSQIINLRHLPLEALSEQLVKDGIDPKYVYLLANLSSSRVEVDHYYNDPNFHEHYNKIIEVTAMALNDKNVITSLLAKYITRTNYKIFTKMLGLFYADIYKTKSNLKTSFNETNVLMKYNKVEFPFWIVLEAIDSFMNSIHLNVGFEISKTKMLIRIEGAYE